MTFKILATIAWVGYQYLQDRARGRIRSAPRDAVILGGTEPHRVQAAWAQRGTRACQRVVLAGGRAGLTRSAKPSQRGRQRDRVLRPGWRAGTRQAARARLHRR